MTMTKRILAVLLILLVAIAPAQVAAGVISAVPLSSTGVNLSTAQTGNADSTNTMDRGYTLGGPCALRVTSTIGGGPTVTVNILGSPDGTNFYNVPYALVATPETPVVTAITITTAVTTIYILRPAQPWRFLKLNYSANTNVTLTVDAFPMWP
jgi:hypothetical protein